MILLDTHVWWWAVSEPERLSTDAYHAIAENPASMRAISSISIWELVMMIEKKRIEIRIPVERWLSTAVNKTGIVVFEINPEIALESCRLPGNFHKDFADRLIAATARVHDLTLITKDAKILNYPYVKTTW